MKTFLSRVLSVLLCTLLIFSLTACGNDPNPNAPETNDPISSENVEENTVTPPLKIAVENQPARSVAVLWYYDEAIRTPYSEIPFNELVFQVDTPSALAGLADGTYDIAILPYVGGETPAFGAYEALPLVDDAFVFVHGKPTPEDASYNLSLDQIRTVYGSSGAYYWDEAQTVPLIPSFWDESLAQPLGSLFDIEATSEGILDDGEWDNPVQAPHQMGLSGATLFPIYYSFLGGEAGINGVVISVDGVLPTEKTIADGTYPLAITYYAVYSADHPNAAQIAAELKIVAQ